MAKTARRSVASDPSTPSSTLHPQLHPHTPLSSTQVAAPSTAAAFTPPHSGHHHSGKKPATPTADSAQSTTTATAGSYQSTLHAQTPNGVSLPWSVAATDATSDQQSPPSEGQPASAAQAGADPLRHAVNPQPPHTTRSPHHHRPPPQHPPQSPQALPVLLLLPTSLRPPSSSGEQHSTLHHHHNNGNSRQSGSHSTSSHRPPSPVSVVAPTPQPTTAQPPPSPRPPRPTAPPKPPVPTANAASPLPPTFNTSRIYDRVAAERERVRTEFYATYDVMTGVRIAATLGGFFALMVFLVVYKSRGESQETIKALKDPKIAAVAAAVMQEEEDRELQEAMEATGMSIYPDEYDHIGYGRERLMSVGNISAPPVFNRGYRFSSIGGGYSSLLSPTRRRFSYSESGRNSVSASSRVLSAYPMGGSFGIDDYFAESDGDDEADDEFDPHTTGSVGPSQARSRRDEYVRRSSGPQQQPPAVLLSVPMPTGAESRRSSNITCCSTESSYLERRCSAITLGLTPLPSVATPSGSRRPSASTGTGTIATSNCLSHHIQPHPEHRQAAWGQDTDNDDLFPGIQVIQPTPRTSPSNSGRASRSPPRLSRSIPERPTGQLPGGVPGVAGPSQYSAAQFRSKSLSLEQPPCSLDSICAYTSPSTSSSTSSAARERSSAMQMAPLGPCEPAAPKGRARLHSGEQTETTSFSQTAPHPSAASAPLRRAPLASISSFKVSSVDYQDSDLKSLGSDSVFAESYFADTDDEMEQFSTDSDDLSASDEQQPQPLRRQPSDKPAQRNASIRLRGTQLPAKPTATTIATVNECPKSPSARGRRILQRSSTIFPSAESLPKVPTPPPPRTPLPVSPLVGIRIETLATIESRRLAPAASVSAASVAAASVGMIQSTPPSTRSLPVAMRPVRGADGGAGSGRAGPAASLSALPSWQRGSAGATAPLQASARPGSASSSSHDGSTSFKHSANSSCNSRNHRQEPMANNVMLEMPTMSEPTGTSNAMSQQQMDPSLPPGSVRKWSRETLF